MHIGTYVEYSFTKREAHCWSMQSCLVQFARTCPSERSFEPVVAFPLFAEEMKRIHDAVPRSRGIERGTTKFTVWIPRVTFSFPFLLLLFPSSFLPSLPLLSHSLIAPSLFFVSLSLLSSSLKNRWWMYVCMYVFNGSLYHDKSKRSLPPQAREPNRNKVLQA